MPDYRSEGVAETEVIRVTLLFQRIVSTIPMTDKMGKKGVPRCQPRKIQKPLSVILNARQGRSITLRKRFAYSGRKRECLSVRKIIKQNTMKLRRAYNLGKGGLKKHLLLLKSIP